MYSEIEHIESQGETIAIVVKQSFNPPTTRFVTDPEMSMQVGYIKYPSGGLIQPHTHLPIERKVHGTSEVLYFISGKAELLLYNDAHHLVAKRMIASGDLVIFVRGGHGVRAIDEILILEVKQGPYTGLQEKERFEP
jgi:oxalate decarboxylase/phosphoglucose isomerase-like protein (cupin superfamily)